MLAFNRIHFRRFKAFSDFSLDIKRLSILVGPNNAGKSTVLSAFRILSSGIKRARNRNAALVPNILGEALGYQIDLAAISIAEENIFYNYDDSEPADITFYISKKVVIRLLFLDANVCSMFVELDGVEITTAAAFKKLINIEIGFVPILGPVEQRELLYEKQAAQLALFNYRAARNFRNIWHHFPLNFEKFRIEIARTWPGMDIQLPEKYYKDNKAYLSMYCLEHRMARELCWSGFGFQVWCQMLTHLIASEGVSLFLIDEPDIYLHSELQRQLLGILRQLGPDILMATHSTEIISDADSEELVVINKHKRKARRIRKPAEVADVLAGLGSSLNPTLTQLAKTKRALFVEGQDFNLISRFARKVGESGVANRRDFAVISTDGFAPEKIRNLKMGIEFALGSEILAAAILDRDYRCDDECAKISEGFADICRSFSIHTCKEIENFLLVPDAIERAAARKSADRSNRIGSEARAVPRVTAVLDEFCSQKRFYVQSQLVDSRKRFERERGSKTHYATIFEQEFKRLDQKWQTTSLRYAIIPGKEALRSVNEALQQAQLGLTDFAIIDAMRQEEVPAEMRDLIAQLALFSSYKVTE